MHSIASQMCQMHIQDPLHQCKLFDALVKTILSFGCEVWGLNSKSGEKVEMLHISFWRNMLHSNVLCIESVCVNSPYSTVAKSLNSGTVNLNQVYSASQVPQQHLRARKAQPAVAAKCTPRQEGTSMSRQCTTCVAYHGQLQDFASLTGIVLMTMTLDSLGRPVGPLLAPSTYHEDSGIDCLDLIVCWPPVSHKDYECN